MDLNGKGTTASRESGRSLTARLSSAAVQEAARRAQLCGLDLPHWAGQVIEAFLAGERCEHGPPRPATSTTSTTTPPDR